MSKPTETKKDAAAKKSALRASLPDLLKRASASPDAAQEALRAYTALRLKPPTLLLTEENIVRALSSVEISKSIGLLSISKECVSLSTVLTALRMKDLADKKSLTQISKAINSNLTKMLGEGTKPNKASKRLKENRSVVFTESTVADAASVILWIVTRLFESQDKGRLLVLPLAIKLIHSLEQIWRRSDLAETAEIVVAFFQSLRRNVKKSVYVDIEDDIEIASFIRDANSALLDWARFALLDGRLKDLQSVLRLSRTDERTKILSELQHICRTRSSNVLPQLIEFVAEEVERDKPTRKPLIAADKSQSSDLNYVAVSMLNAWDAASEGERSTQTLQSIRQLARELFNVEFANTPGEIVTYDERQHEITPPGSRGTTNVEIMRPGIQWSDGTRTRSLVRAVVRSKD
jgi:hypothetical protein